MEKTFFKVNLRFRLDIEHLVIVKLHSKHNRVTLLKKTGLILNKKNRSPFLSIKRHLTLTRRLQYRYIAHTLYKLKKNQQIKRHQ